MSSFIDPFSQFGSTGLGNNGFEVSLNYISGVPDINLLSDAKLKVIFKSMLKKDDTTKEKALLDFLKILSDASQSYVIDDEMVVVSWVQFYPKLAIDVSKNVRLSSHQVQCNFVKVLGKKYAKYLKDTAPIWLAGTFDSERIVSRGVIESLVDAFQSQEKVELLWKAYSEQTLKFCLQVVRYETRDSLSSERNVGKDEAEAKYIRVVNCALNLFTKLVSMQGAPIQDQDPFIDFLKLEQLWDLSTTKDLSLKKSLFTLIITVIKTHSELVDNKTFKLISKSVIKSLRYKPATNNIIYSLIVLPTLSCILTLSNFNLEFWEIAGKKAKEKLMAFLELGSCSSSETYYDLVQQMFLNIPSSILDFKSEVDFSQIHKILVKDVEQERLIPFKNKAWSCFFNVHARFYQELPATVALVLNPFLVKQLQTRLTKDIIKSFATFVNSVEDEKLSEHITETIVSFLPNKVKGNNLFIENSFDLLNASNLANLDRVAKAAFDSLDSVEDEEGAYSPPFPCLAIFSKIITSGLVAFKPDVDSFLENVLASLVEKGFVEEPLALLITYNNGKEFLDPKVLNDSFNSVFNKLLLIDENLVQLALEKLPRLTNIDVSSCPDVHSFIVEKSESTEYADTGKRTLIFNFLTKEVFINLLKQSIALGETDNFVSEFLSKFDKNVFAEFLDSGDDTVTFLLNHLFATIKDSSSEKLLRAVDKEHDKIYIKSLVSYVSMTPFVSNIDDIVSHLLNSRPFSISSMLPSVQDFIHKMSSSVGDSVDLRLSVANPLEGNVFLVRNELKSSFDAEKVLRLVAYSRFLLALVAKDTDLRVEPAVIVCLAAIGEIASDYCFLTGDENNDIVSFQSESSSLLNKNVSNISLGELIDAIFNDKQHEMTNETLRFFASQLQDQSAVSYYFSRVVKSVLTPLFERESLQSFEKLNVDASKFVRHPLKLATLIMSCGKFLTSAKFERVRNVLASELIGLKTSQVLEKGLIYLTLLSNFLSVDTSYLSNENAYVFIPEQRLNMVLRDIGNWLESDIAYDDEFLMVRVQLISFVNNFIQLALQPEVMLGVTKILDIGMALLRDSLGLIAAASDESTSEIIVSLKYHSLKLFIILEKNKQDIEAWSDDIEAVYEELTETLLSPNSLVSNQPQVLIQDLYYRIFDSLIPLQFLKADDYYKLLEADIGLQKLAVNVLDKLILSQQQDNVIEYELNRSKISAEGEEDENHVKIPDVFIGNVGDVPDEYLEFENSITMNKYLWSWFLVFDHFKDITQGMRHLYIKQLESQFNKFFQFVFDQIHLDSDMDLIKRLSSANEISNYNLSDFSSTTEDQKHLIIHLYYLSFAYVGSLARTWFYTIRDRQLKNSIEKFSINYISPIVIEAELDKASVAIKQNPTFNDENLTIKINRVTHEIRSLYLIDEKSMEMVIKIPASYPLQNVIVDGPVRLGVKETQWKSWLLASQRIITSQNSTIMGAVELFNKNVSLHFSGFEECAICYSILHYQDNSLPSKTCTTCNNKFHAGCLYKWFKSSGGSTCPLCRSTFNFRK